MSVLEAVCVELDAAGVVGWRREVVEALAGSLDEAPNASTAKELQSLMAVLVGGVVEDQGDLSDDLAAKRVERRRASGS